MVRISKISFSEVSKRCGCDSNNLVWMALSIQESDIPEIESWWKEIKLIDEDSKIVEVAIISGNVLGDSGRTDVYFKLSGKGVVNPLVRLGIPDLKWLTDFVGNCREDYE